MSEDDRAKSCMQKTLVLSDSVGRGISLVLSDRLQPNHTVSGIVKAGANIFEVVKDTQSKDKLEADHIVIIAGTDALRVGQLQSLYEKIEQIVSSFPQSQTIVVTVPTRRDLPSDHVYNNDVNLLNAYIRQTCERYANVRILDINTLKRRHFAKNGIHLNKKGKLHISKLIIQMINNASELKIMSQVTEKLNFPCNADTNNNEGIVFDSRSIKKDRKVDIWIVSLFSLFINIASVTFPFHFKIYV